MAGLTAITCSRAGGGPTFLLLSSVDYSTLSQQSRHVRPRRRRDGFEKNQTIDSVRVLSADNASMFSNHEATTTATKTT